MNERIRIEVKAFDNFEVRVNGRKVIRFDGFLTLRLFFFLVDRCRKNFDTVARNQGSSVTRAEIFAAFWPNLITDDATNVFHVTKNKVNFFISDNAEQGGFTGFVDMPDETGAQLVEVPRENMLTMYTHGVYVLSGFSIVGYDVEKFEEAFEAAMTDENYDNYDAWRSASVLYTGKFLASPRFDEYRWVIDRRQELETMFITCQARMKTLKSLN